MCAHVFAGKRAAARDVDDISRVGLAIAVAAHARSLIGKSARCQGGHLGAIVGFVCADTCGGQRFGADDSRQSGGRVNHVIVRLHP